MAVTLPPTPPINAIPRGRIYTVARQWTDAQLNAAVRAVMIAHYVSDYYWINVYAPTQFVDLKLHRPPLKRVYYSVDAIEVNPYTRKHGVLAEAEQAKRADLVATTSRSLARKHFGKLETSRAKKTRVEVIPNAIDARLYLDRPLASEPPELRGIPHPRLGYVGNLDAVRLDYEGIYTLAAERPDYHLVLIGPWNGEEAWRVRLSALPNVHFLGAKPQTACLDYLQHVDLGLIPFAHNALTAAIYPLKINEYLALGLPVVASRFSDDIADFADVIALAESSDWPAAVDEELTKTASDIREVRICRARSNDWAARVERILSLLGAVEAVEAVEPQSA